MMVSTSPSTGHEELHKKVHRIRGKAWESYCTLPQPMLAYQPAGNVTIQPKRRPLADDPATFQEEFFVKVRAIVESTNVQIPEVLRETLQSLRIATEPAQWSHLTSTESGVIPKLPAITEGSEMTLFHEHLQTLFECPDKSDWNDAKNDRRCDLIDKEIEGTLLPAEKPELEELQRQMLAYRRKVAPLPLKEAQRLHQHLLKKATEQVD